MIIFLDFAPFEFNGGAEKWMIEKAIKAKRNEEVTLISVSSTISNYYSKIILGRNFDTRISVPVHAYTKKISLEFSHFIPFTKKWTKIKKVFLEARLLYYKYELPEFLISLYFGGPRITKKMIAGLHTAFVYSRPDSFFEKLHNFVYLSKLSKYILGSLYKVHVITSRDENYLMNEFGLKNVFFIPNSIKLGKQLSKTYSNQDRLDIVFVGELSIKKGVDVLIDIIKASPENFNFSIVGNGPLKDKINELEKECRNCHYFGYLDQDKLGRVYRNNDVLLLPSKAEGFPVVVLEAMSQGLLILDSTDIKLNLPTYIENSIKPGDPKLYVRSLNKILTAKKLGHIDRNKIRNFVIQNFSNQKIDSQFEKKVLGFNI